VDKTPAKQNRTGDPKKKALMTTATIVATGEKYSEEDRVGLEKSRIFLGT